jgi:Mrp family chromosome partitioning ATPase
VRTAPDAADAAGLRLLGMVPRAVVVRNSLPDALSNRRIGPAIRNLRTQLDRVTQREEPSDRARVLVVTSAIEGQGKTTLATLLALAAARVQQRVLLIDGDLVRPSLDQVFRLAPKPGLAQALRGGELDARSFVRNEMVPNLSIMPTTVDSEAGDLLSRQMGRVLHWASESYDRVIVDAAPVLGNDAGPTLSTFADDVLVVVRRGVRVSLVEEALAVLRSLEAPLVGVIANTTPVMEQYGYYD